MSNRTPTPAPPGTKLVEPPVYQQITEAMQRVLEAADHLVREYTERGHGYGTGVGMRAAEDRLIREVRDWRRVCGARQQ